jgi:EAL domain-containing protein (putative c-di-GMP-specific phosphodiesterase class I)
VWGEAPEIEDLLRSLIGTAESFGLAILAEGVERAEQAHFLLSHDCRHVQGYLFGRPAPMRDVGAIIAKDLRNIAAVERSGNPAISSGRAQQIG